MLTQCCLNPMVLRMCMCGAGCAGPMAIPMECTWATKRARWRSRGGTSARASDKKTNPHMCSRIQCAHREKTDRYRVPVSAKKKPPAILSNGTLQEPRPPSSMLKGVDSGKKFVSTLCFNIEFEGGGVLEACCLSTCQGAFFSHWPV